MAVVGDLATVVGSDLPLSLGRRRRSATRRGSARPRRVVVVVGYGSPGDLSRQRAFVRAAAAYRWEYVLLDAGWNAGDVPEIARYAAPRA